MYQFRGIARTDLGDPDGLDDVRKGLEVALEIGDLGTAGSGYSNLASIAYLISPADALDVWNEGIAFDREAAACPSAGTGWWPRARGRSPTSAAGTR